MIYTNDTISSTGNNYLVTVAEALEYLRPKAETTNSSLSSFVTHAISYVSDSIEAYCNKGIKTQTYTGYYDGNNCSILYTDNYPIQSISSIQYRITPLDTYQNLLPDISQFTFNYKTYIQLYTYLFPYGNKSIKIIYDAGFDVIPGDIKLVALEMIQMIYDNSKHGNNLLGYKTINDNSGTVSIAKSIDYVPIKKEHEKILSRYKKYEM